MVMLARESCGSLTIRSMLGPDGPPSWFLACRTKLGKTSIWDATFTRTPSHNIDAEDLRSTEAAHVKTRRAVLPWPMFRAKGSGVSRWEWIHAVCCNINFVAVYDKFWIREDMGSKKQHAWSGTTRYLQTDVIWLLLLPPVHASLQQKRLNW